jgi:hypothetical protein
VYEISTIFLFVVYFVCTLIFGLIVNTIVTKIIAADTQGSESIDSAPISPKLVLSRRETEERFDSERSA